MQNIMSLGELSDLELCEEVARIQKIPYIEQGSLHFFNPITHPHQLFPLIEQHKINIEWITPDMGTDLEYGVVVCVTGSPYALFTDNIKQLPQLVLMAIIEAHN